MASLAILNSKPGNAEQQALFINPINTGTSRNAKISDISGFGFTAIIDLGVICQFAYGIMCQRYAGINRNSLQSLCFFLCDLLCLCGSKKLALGAQVKIISLQLPCIPCANP
ncbi:MAG: hypothetical protein JXA03_02835 [Bacteroidales bacterium]|nr:hypothetical protein [Bacteroidales bacterium]